MPRPPANAALDRALEQALRTLARLGAVAAAGVSMGLRSRRGQRAAHALDARLAQADQMLERHSPVLETFANHTLGLLDRLFARFSKWLS